MRSGHYEFPIGESVLSSRRSRSGPGRFTPPAGLQRKNAGARTLDGVCAGHSLTDHARKAKTHHYMSACRGCGCTETRACHDVITDTPCYWVEPDLCSVCAHPQLDHNLIHELIVAPRLSLGPWLRQGNDATLLAASVILAKAGNDEKAVMISAWVKVARAMILQGRASRVNGQTPKLS